MYQFFFSPKYFFLFRSLSSAGCISVRESLSFQNNYFGEEAKIIIKLLQTQKKMIWNAKSSRQTKVVWLNAMFFVTQRNFFFFFHAGFVWMIELVKKKCFVLSTRFPLSKTALFLPKLHSVLKKKGIEGKSCFCVLCNRVN